jgi:hypothetical protein
VADLAAQCLGPDPKPTGSVEHAPAPGALVDQPVGGAWIRQAVERRQGQLHEVGDPHVLDADDTMRVSNSPVEQLGITSPSLQQAGLAGRVMQMWLTVSGPDTV